MAALGRSPEDFCTLSADQVGALILADLQKAPGQQLYARNYSVQVQEEARRARASADMVTRVGAVAMEGWQWLRSNGFVAPDPNEVHWERLTREGRDLDPAAYLAEAGAMGILAGAVLDDELMRTVRPLIRAQRFDDAVLAAMRLVEDRVRFAGRFSNSDIGVPLMRSAFGARGPLRDPKLHPAEGDARMELFTGAIGCFKNPVSHRVVGNQRDEAIEVILLSNALLRQLGEAEAATRGRGRPRKRQSP